ncbi:MULTISPECIES: hypothetical protein [unclassified Paenibacillus]|uniref:hypothetical protein n=1 Tax=unclassified Paenibacillus TaxID=185978 RepID=UPI000955A83B|nr:MULTISPECIES: hypothetical protein [unclassified Paenibacillus]ASS65902.1 hypothetical protein CIC07_06910 [Paenibacillus sp. RUD330]SIQ19565.1 hypothetical protein SAMN05880555_0977 [Paenibacillus sp. RU4X]SIQ41185.1 hypothetical protein SAMN05880570_0976 [Paenibacillus sp. RU4T]
MSTGSKLAAVVLTAVLGTASAGAVQAAASQPSTGKLQWTVNGQSSELRTLVLNGQQLVSVSDAAKALGAEVEIMPEGAGIRITLGEHSVLVKAGSKPLNEDGTAFGQVVQSWKQANYVDGASYVQALGGSYSLLDGSGISIQTLQLLEGAETAQWAGDGRLIVSVSDESGRTDYLVDATTGAYSQLLSSSGASDLVVSPDGGHVAFSETDGTLHTVDLNTLRMAKIGTDTSIKSNLQWSADGKSIYFLQGDKTNVIAAADVATGAISKVLDDKVEYKGDLSVTAGGLSYSVVKAGTVTADAAKAVELDDVAIDDSQTNPQLFDLDLGKTDAKPVQVTKSDDGKLFIQRSAAGKVYYVQAGDEGSNSKLASATAAGQAVAFDKEDVQEAVQAGSYVGILTDRSVYVLNEESGSVSKLADAPEGASNLTLSKDGSKAALIADGKLQVLSGGKWISLTK